MNSVVNKDKINLAKSGKEKIKFDKTPWYKKLFLRVFSMYFLEKVVWTIFRLVLLVGISYIIIFPFFTKISASFMSPSDFVDATVKLIPKYPTLDTYKYIIIENKYFEALANTATLSLLTAFLQTFITALIGYGFAKFRFKGRGLLFGFVVLTMVIPHETIMLSMFMKFRYFDIFGIYAGLNNIFHFSKSAKASIDLINSFWPLTILSACGLAFKNGLYVFIFRQFFKGVPDELEEAAYVDGSGIFQTYFKIILPSAIPMMVTIFMFAFSWQWTDNYYTSLFFTGTKIHLLPRIVEIPSSLMMSYAADVLYSSAILNTAGLLVIAPLFIIFLFAQNALVQGIERSGIVG